MLLGVFIAGVLGLAARLVQLQVVDAAYYQERTEQALLVPPRSLPFVRGSLRDRTGALLVNDEPCWDVTVDFGLLAADVGADQSAITRQCRRMARDRGWPRSTPLEELGPLFHQEMDEMWADLAQVAAASRALDETDLREIARRRFDRVIRVRKQVAESRGFDAPVAEESVAQVILSSLTPTQQIRARELLQKYSSVHVEPSSRRRIAENTEALAHLLGRLGRVDAQALENDPAWDDPFARYLSDDWIGVSGMEYVAEQTLRGRRGQILLDRGGQALEEIQAEHGNDVYLTIDAALQQRLYDLLGEAVHDHPDASGGAVVVLDVATREVLALVSYPSYNPLTLDEDYDRLLDDTEHMPLRFRAVATQYAPGSTVKPLACISALIHHLITPESVETCTGYLFDDVRDAWRCWEVHGTGIRKAHGTVNLVQALTGSCNVFMFRLGERLGVDRLTRTFALAGIGAPTGTGLREETAGINPTPAWLRHQRRTAATVGLARQYAIGQGEVAMTPVQVANLMAAYASGVWRPVSMIRGAAPTAARTIARPAEWDPVRLGIFGVTNDPEGTAYKYAHFERDGYTLCGKTGSATVNPRPTAYRIPYADTAGRQHVAVVREGAMEPALQRFRTEFPDATADLGNVEVASRWPTRPPREGEHHSHAWFGGYLQPVDEAGRADLHRPAPIAFALLVEYGGSGGQTAGPTAKRMADAIFDVLGPLLRPRGIGQIGFLP
mgnify:CR=1 FL=1